MMAPFRVLIAEDDHDICAAVVEILESEGHVAIAAKDGRDALKAAREQRPDVILFDISMSPMNGWDFRAAQLRDPLLADIPVAVVSGASSDVVHRMPADAHLRKPFEIDELLDVVVRLGESARSRSAA